jgi:AAA domain, putative AbiEii toxin, Type IV TA system
VRIVEVEITNYRGFDSFSWRVDGQSCFLVSRNGGGKTSLLSAIATTLGRERMLSRNDFGDTAQPLEIVVALEMSDPSEAGPFADYMTFGTKPSLKIGVRASWEVDGDEVDVTSGFPDKQWKRIARRDFQRIPVLWVPASRDPGRLLSFGLRSGVLRTALNEVDIQSELQAAEEAVALAAQQLASAQPIADVLASISDHLATIIPGIDSGAFGVVPGLQTGEDLLRQLQLALAHGSTSLPTSKQSSGLGHLSFFSFLLAVTTTNSIALIDEPELSLHPQAQRALASAMRNAAGQSIISTHSTAILDRVDPRQVIRLTRDTVGVELKHSASLSDADAQGLARFATSRTAEAYFADTVILVEGMSDEVAIKTLALRLGRNLDGAGVSLVALDGAPTLAAYLQLLGPAGLDLRLLGLCDADYEDRWRKYLTAGGVVVADRNQMNQRGFQVADPDLEIVLVRALGPGRVEEIVDMHGRGSAFATFRQQPTQSGKSAEELICDFIKRDKIYWAPRLVDELDLAARSPEALFDLVDAL